ncbi:MAG TPA: hypothetical protein VFJ93_13625, partial [Gaiellaceae bacterium]|nr:hypothetical protein [Gaiellaceae bacterium]
SGSGTDADADSLTYHWSYTSGAGVDAGTTCSFSPSATSQNPSVTCNDDGSFNVSLVTNDGTADSAASIKGLVFTNAPPVLGAFTTPTVGQLFPVNSGPSVSIPYTDAGAHDTHTCAIDWDDGNGFVAATTTEAAGSGSGTCKGTKAYTAAGVFTVRARVTDDDGDTDTESILIVVYDPSAGFVTGGGWINSPAGAYQANPLLAGKANFGFNAQYKKGANVPTGQTEFQFQLGDLNFHSESYDWLVVSGPSKAQYKGKGTINGAGNYGFLLTAYDGSPDKFRIKIWDIDNGGTIVYDNNYTASDDIDAAAPTAIAGGSIVIHK